MPPWWRLNEDYFRELRQRDLARVAPRNGWLADADPDLVVPPRGRPARPLAQERRRKWEKGG